MRSEEGIIAGKTAKRQVLPQYGPVFFLSHFSRIRDRKRTVFSAKKSVFSLSLTKSGISAHFFLSFREHAERKGGNGRDAERSMVAGMGGEGKTPDNTAGKKR
jgi:hypothetical protein